MIDPIADMLTRIRNALAVRKTEVVIPYSRLKFLIANVLEEGRWVESIEKIEGSPAASIRIILRYEESGLPTIQTLKRISSPGRRVYTGHDNLPRVLNNYGIAIVSTSQGIMTNTQARKLGIGGEILCEIN